MVIDRLIILLFFCYIVNQSNRVMKKTYLKVCGVLVIAVMLIAGCRKDTTEINKGLDLTTGLQTKPSSGDDNGGCRLVSDTSEFGDLFYAYNQRGLVDKWSVSYLDGYLTMEYNESGHLVKSKYYSEGALVNTIVFAYQGNQVVKETWFDRDSQTKTDEVFYSFNRNGMVWKSQSIIGDYSSIYKYTPDGGSVAEWDFYLGGVLNYVQQFTYLPPHHIDPNLAAPGLQYQFPSPNGRVSQSKWYSTSEKDISYDENGENPQIVLDQYPDKSVLQANRYNYVTITDFFDNLTQTYAHFRFKYENCGSDDSDAAPAASVLHSAEIIKMNLPKFLRHSPSSSIKTQVQAFRKLYLNKP